MKNCACLLALSLFTFGLMLAGCDSGGVEESLSIEGTWQGVSADAVPFLYIDLPILEAYEDSGDCYVLDRGRLERISGNMFEITEDDGTPDTLTLRVQNDILFAEENGAEYRFRRSNADVTTFTICN